MSGCGSWAGCETLCDPCSHFNLGMAYTLARQTDQAITVGYAGREGGRGLGQMVSSCQCLLVYNGEACTHCRTGFSFMGQACTKTCTD